MTIIGGVSTPKIALTAPFVWLTVRPIKSAELKAITPGNELVSSKMSENCFLVSNFFWLTNSLSINGSMAAPPPSVKSDILKKEM